MTDIAVRSCVVPRFTRGRPCRIRKERLVSFIFLSRMKHQGYEEMELNSELFLKMHYDHSAFQYHYTQLSEEVIVSLTNLFKDKINELLTEDILFHIFDSTALSTSVRVERTRAGLRNKVKLTEKFHTMLGYDPPNQIVVVEAMLASDHHTSDNQGALLMIHQGLKGFALGDSAYETYELVQQTEFVGLIPLYKPTKKEVKKKLSAKARRRKDWKGNPSRWYKELRGVGEVLYGAATRAGLIHTHSKYVPNMFKDALIIGLRQNVLTYLRLRALMRFIRKTHEHP